LRDYVGGRLSPTKEPVIAPDVTRSGASTEVIDR
jgi:hypothetical protein